MAQGGALQIHEHPRCRTLWSAHLHASLVLKQDAKFLLLSPFTSSPGDKGPPLNQNFTGLDPSDDVIGVRIMASFLNGCWVFRFPCFQRNCSYPLSHPPVSTLLLLNRVMNRTVLSL